MSKEIKRSINSFANCMFSFAVCAKIFLASSILSTVNKCCISVDNDFGDFILPI